jgi:hypothetical protein
MTRYLVLMMMLLNSTGVFALLRDPTRPSFEKNAASEEGFLVLRAIIISGDYRMAVINGKVFKENDVIGETKIIKIESDKIEIEQENTRKILYLVSQPIKQKVIDQL